MPKLLEYKTFCTTYYEVVDQVLSHWTPQMQSELSLHNQGWAEENHDFRIYLRASAVRFYKAYCSLAMDYDDSLCDIGGFWGVFPVTMRRLGYRHVSMTEALQYYSSAFDSLFEYIRNEGVKVLDYDPFIKDSNLNVLYSHITVLAVLEHYPHSLKVFMENVSKLLTCGGHVYIEVPNIAYWSKRVRLLFGKTPLFDIGTIYSSDVPFVGHHHEFTMSELKKLISLAGFNLLEENYYNYDPGDVCKLKTIIKNPVKLLAFRYFKNTRECLSVLCNKKNIDCHD